MDSIVSIGRLSIPLWAIMLFLGYVAGSVALRVAIPGERELRSRISDRFSTALIFAFLIWKLAPLVTEFRIVVATPLYLLYASGGAGSVIIGALVGGIYYLLATRPQWAAEVRSVMIRGTLAFLLSGVAVVFVGGAIADSALSRSPGDAPRLDFTLYDLDGVEGSLSDYDQWVIVNFWATWCPPCRAEAPLLAEYYDTAGETDPVLISVNQTASEGSLDALKSFIEENNIHFRTYLDPDNRVFTRFGIRGLPTTVVIAPDGTIADRRVGVVTGAWIERQRARSLATR